MNDIEFSPAQRDLLRDKLSKYYGETLNLELEQSDVKSFAGFIVKELGSLFYNVGIGEAIRTYLAWGEWTQEETDLKKVY